jgi:hypothetical protein
MPENSHAEPTPEHMKQILQQAILRNYPNPERRGCPGSEALRAGAQRKLPHEDPNWEHITHCSPCYQEFLAFRAAVLEGRRSRRRLRTAGAAAAVIIVAVVSAWLAVGTREKAESPAPVASQTRPAEPPPGGTSTQRTITAVLNFESDSITRGAEGERSAGADLQRVPRGRVALFVYLPLGSEPGHYEVRLLQNRSDPNPLVSFGATGELEDGLTVLRITADLSEFKPGTYTVAIRRRGESWRYRRIVIS